MLNAPSLSGTWLATFSAAVHLVLKSCFILMSFFLPLAGLAVVTKVGRGAVGPTVGNFVAFIVSSLRDERFGVRVAASGGFILAH